MQKLKIFIIIAVSFLTVKLLTPQIFLANTPRINPLFVAHLKNSPYYLVNLPANILAYLKNTVKNTTANIAQNTSRMTDSLMVKTGNQTSSLSQKSKISAISNSSSTNNRSTTQTSSVSQRTGPYVKDQPLSVFPTQLPQPTLLPVPSDWKRLPAEKEEIVSAVDKLASVTPPPQASFLPVAEGVSVYKKDSSSNEIILKIDKGTQYTVEHFQLPNGEIREIIVLE